MRHQKETIEPILQRNSQLDQLPSMLSEAKFLGSLRRDVLLVLLLNSMLMGVAIFALEVAPINSIIGALAFPVLIMLNYIFAADRIWAIIPRLARYPSSDAVSAISVSAALRFYFSLVYGFAFLYCAFSLFGAEFSREIQPFTALYFSAVTTTTLGYGDIVPVSPGARAVTAANAVLGVAFFLYSIALSTLSVAASLRIDFEANKIVQGCIDSIHNEIVAKMGEVGQEGFVDADYKTTRDATIRYIFSRARE